MQSTSERVIAASQQRTLAAVSEAAEIWGAAWQPDTAAAGRLDLPFVQGLRHGVAQTSVRVAAAPEGTLLRATIESSHSTLNRSAVVVLLLGALGGLTLVFWPLSPRILQLAPIGAVLAIVAWLLVVARLRQSGLEDFLDLVETCSAET